MENEPSPAERDGLDQLLFAGRKIQGVKFYRKIRNCSLVEAKEAMDAREKVLKEEDPQRFRQQPAGCMGAIALLVAGPLLLAAKWLCG